MFEDFKPEEIQEMKEVLKRTGSNDKAEAMDAQKILASSIETPLKQGIVVGDIISQVYTETPFDINARVEFPIDFYRLDNSGDFVAYVIPNQGKIPSRQVEGDYVTVPTYEIGAGIDWLRRYSREARWDIVSRGMEVLEAGIIKKKNDDGWHTLLSAGYDRNILVNDSNAAAGQFTKRLISLMKLVMRRNSGGNSASINRGKLTHVFLSPEALEDMRNWSIDQVDEFTRRDIYVAEDGTFNRVFGVNLVDLDELGQNQEYQDYYTNVTALGAGNSGLAAGDVELLIGLDLSRTDSFVMPVRQPLEINQDESAFHSRRVSYWANMELGFAVLNSARCLLASL